MSSGVPTPGSASVPFPDGKFKTLQYQIEFLDNGENNLSVIGDVTNYPGKHQVTGDQITFTHADCGTDEGLYKWILEDDTLTFEKIIDNCYLRSEAMHYPWTR